MCSLNKVLVVNETFARHFFGGENPIGRRWVLPMASTTTRSSASSRTANTQASGKRACGWCTFHFGRDRGHRTWSCTCAPRPTRRGSPSQLRERVRALDASATVFDVHTVRDEIDRSLLRERLLGTITSLFGGLALLLAAIGLYGTMSYGVARRTREFGIRSGDWAGTGTNPSARVARSALAGRRGHEPGTRVSVGSRPVVSSMLFAIEPTDLDRVWRSPASCSPPLRFGAASIPARRASKVDPMTALRAP